jgi:hypothetical protein
MQPSFEVNTDAVVEHVNAPECLDGRHHQVLDIHSGADIAMGEKGCGTRLAQLARRFLTIGVVDVADDCSGSLLTEE